MPKQNSTSPDQVLLEKFKKFDLVGKVKFFLEIQQILEIEKEEAHKKLEALKPVTKNES